MFPLQRTGAEEKPPAQQVPAKGGGKVPDSPPPKKMPRWKMRDPADGKFDLSEWLTDAKGFLPIPLFVTEPAVGVGGGACLLFFHDSIRNRAKRLQKTATDGHPPKVPPPSLSGVAGIGTENGTWGSGIFHLGIWKEDTVRYLGLLGYASVNYDLYQRNHPTPINLEGLFLKQQLLFRLRKSDFFAGGNYLYFSSTATSDRGVPLPPPAGDGIELSVGGLSAVLGYDSRDNIFTPNKGASIKTEWSHFAPWLGGEGTFDRLRLYNRFWHPITKTVVLGLRCDAEFSGGDIPFYMRPFVFLRGIPIMRYQGDHALATEAELRWDFTPRWSLVGFGGAGWTSNDGFSGFDLNEGHPAGGVGFRYLIARLFGLRAGMDFGVSEDDSGIYFTVGGAWY